MKDFALCKSLQSPGVQDYYQMLFMINCNYFIYQIYEADYNLLWRSMISHGTMSFFFFFNSDYKQTLRLITFSASANWGSVLFLCKCI